MKISQFEYVLDGHHVRPAKSLEELLNCFRDINARRVGLTKTRYFSVSTVFLCIQHNLSKKGPPILFETLVYTTDEYDKIVPPVLNLNGYVVRYSSWDDAETGHKTIVRTLTKQLEDLGHTVNLE